TDSLQRDLTSWFMLTRNMMKARVGKGGADAARAMLDGAEQQRLMAEVYRRAAGMRGEEVRLLGERSGRTDTLSQRLVLAIEIGTIVGVLIVGLFARRMLRDFHAFRTADDAARDSERELREFFENTSDIIYTTGPTGELLYTNPAWRSALGYTEEEVRGMWLSQVIHPDSLERAIALFHRIMAGEVMHAVDVDCITKDGRRISVMGSSHRRMKGGVAVGTNSISADITERRAAERRVAESHALVQAVLNSTSYLIVACDTVGTITGLNPVAAEALGCTEEEAVGRLYVESLFDEDFEAVVASARASGRDDRERTLRRH